MDSGVGECLCLARPRTSARPSALQVKVDYWNPVFAGHDFAKESEKTHKPDVIFLQRSRHRLQSPGAARRLINKGWDNIFLDN